MEETGIITHPLLSCSITLYSLFLLYLPYDSFQSFLSPVPLLAGAILISLLRLGSTRESNAQPSNTDEWNLKLGASLHEEEEEVEESSITGLKDQNRLLKIDIFKPEYNLDSDSEFDSVMSDYISPENEVFRWEEEEEGDELIEIQLDEYFSCHHQIIEQNLIDLDFLAEEESFIEIDISSSQ